MRWAVRSFSSSARVDVMSSATRSTASAVIAATRRRTRISDRSRRRQVVSTASAEPDLNRRATIQGRSALDSKSPAALPAGTSSGR